MNPLPMTERIDRVQRRHPEILVAAPWATRSGRWQLIGPGVEESYENGFECADDLERRYPEP